MDKLLITVQVADREYRMHIEKDEEELVRQAVKTINENIKTYAENYEFKDKQDLLAMVVLQNTIKAMGLEEMLGSQQERLSDKLYEINRILTKYLSEH